MFNLHGQISEMPSALGAASGCPCLSLSANAMGSCRTSGRLMNKTVRKQLWRIEKSHFDFSSQPNQLANPLDT
jgi:hypothetical protein